jgi:hypothetical protein
MGAAETVTAFGPMRAIPTSIVVDRQGMIRYRHSGLISMDELETEITKLL